jgi:hypothetical protein
MRTTPTHRVCYCLGGSTRGVGSALRNFRTIQVCPKDLPATPWHALRAMRHIARAVRGVLAWVSPPPLDMTSLTLIAAPTALIFTATRSWSASRAYKQRAAPAVPRAPAPSPKLTMGMPKATRGLASVFGTELTDGWVRPETSRASRDPPVQAPRPGLFFWRQTPDRQRCGDHQDGADNTNDRKLAEHYQVSLGHTLPLGQVYS